MFGNPSLRYHCEQLLKDFGLSVAFQGEDPETRNFEDILATLDCYILWQTEDTKSNLNVLNWYLRDIMDTRLRGIEESIDSVSLTSFNGLNDKMNMIGNDLWGIAGDIMGGIGGLAEGLLEAFAGVAEDIEGGISNTVGQVKDLIKTSEQTVKGAIGSNALKIGQMISNASGEIQEGINAALDAFDFDIGDFIPDAVTGIIDALKALKDLVDLFVSVPEILKLILAFQPSDVLSEITKIQSELKDYAR